MLYKNSLRPFACALSTHIHSAHEYGIIDGNRASRDIRDNERGKCFHANQQEKLSEWRKRRCSLLRDRDNPHPRTFSHIFQSNALGRSLSIIQLGAQLWQAEPFVIVQKQGGISWRYAIRAGSGSGSYNYPIQPIISSFTRDAIVRNGWQYNIMRQMTARRRGGHRIGLNKSLVSLNSRKQAAT